MTFRIRPLVAAVMPTAALRAWAYRVLTGGRLGRGVRLSWGAYIDAKSAKLGDGVRIGRFTVIKEVDELELGDGVEIGPWNHFAYLAALRIGARSRFSSHLTATGSAWSGEKGSLVVGERVVVTGKHHFDCTRTISIGDDSTVAGVFSSIWTHGYRWESLQDVVIGKRCYIGASVKIASGTKLADDTVVAMGAVVRGEFSQRNCLVAGVPAQVVRRDYNPKRVRRGEGGQEEGRGETD